MRSQDDHRASSEEQAHQDLGNLSHSQFFTIIYPVIANLLLHISPVLYFIFQVWNFWVVRNIYHPRPHLPFLTGLSWPLLCAQRRESESPGVSLSYKGTSPVGVGPHPCDLM